MLKKLHVPAFLALGLLCTMELLEDGGMVRSSLRRLAVPMESTYESAVTESYIMEHFESLGFDKAEATTKGCSIWKDPKASSPEIYEQFQGYRKDLQEKFIPAVQAFEPIPDLMDTIRKTPGYNKTILCETANVHPDGLKALFPNSELSKGDSGFLEPLATPMRHPGYCWDRRAHLLDLDYLVHDFEAMCLKLKPTSRRVLIDMGADLTRENGPVIKLLDLYDKFGFVFDHIYGYEMKFTDPEKVFNEQLPTKYMAPFHWINAAVSSDKKAKTNPLYTILNEFDEDDFIVLKLDIDHAATEVPLAMQVLEDENIYKKIDQMYFEHHVFMEEIASTHGASMQGSIKDTMEVFHGLRQKGISSHFWI